jgi:hypothetical protein
MSDRGLASQLSDQQSAFLAAIGLVLGGILGAFLWPIPDATTFDTGEPLPGQIVGPIEHVPVDCGNALSNQGGSDCDDNRLKPRLVFAAMFIGGVLLGARSQMRAEET